MVYFKNFLFKKFSNWKLEIVKRNDKLTGFHILPKRWIVERTFAWLNCLGN